MEKLLLPSPAHLSALPNNMCRHGRAFGCKSCEIKGLCSSLGVTRRFFPSSLRDVGALGQV